MNKIPITPIALLAVAAAFLSVACSSKPKPVTAPEAKPVAAAATPTPTPAPAPAEKVEQEPEVPVHVSVEELNRRGYLKDAFFDYNRYEIRQDQRDTLEKDAAWLRQNQTVQITVEGHCDERGTAQYNMALGQQRAQAVKDYLVQLGIDPSRIQIISYGNERPFVIGHDEEAWAQNRRDHFLVTAG
jgi:peptidoglycan-associated lipoprotein